MDTAHVEVRVTDYNDNAPLFTPNSKTVTIYENVTVGTTLHRFTASDRDTGLNRLFTYVLHSANSLHVILWHSTALMGVTLNNTSD